MFTTNVCRKMLVVQFLQMFAVDLVNFRLRDIFEDNIWTPIFPIDFISASSSPKYLFLLVSL